MALKKNLPDLPVKENANGNKQDVGNNEAKTLSVENEFFYENKVVHIENDYWEPHGNPGSACNYADVECVAVKNEDGKEKQNEPYSKMEEYS